jgi:hypothetical protein
MSAPRRFHGVAAALLGLALLATAAAAGAQGKGDADTHFRHGVELYRDGDFSAALVEFKRAYDSDPKYQVLYNVAESYDQLQDYASALKAFQEYLYDGGGKIGPKRRKEVDKEIAKLRQRVAVVTVTTSEPGATVAVDDLPVGTSPLAEPILVSAGRRRLTATLPGRVPVTQIVDVAGGDAPTVALTIPALGDATVKVATPERPSLTIPLILWGATAAVVTSAVVTGVLALGASSDLKTDLAAFPGDPAAITAARHKDASFALATDVLTGTALAAGGVAVYFTVRQVAQGRAAPTTTPAAGRFVVYPTFPAGVGAAGSF